MRFVKRSRLAVGVLERFERADHFVLVHVRRGIAQRLHPIAGKDRGVLLRARLRRGDDDASGLLQRADRPATGAGRVDDQLALGGDAVAQHGDLFAGDIRTGQVEFVLLAVEGAVADQDQREFVIGLRVARNLG